MTSDNTSPSHPEITAQRHGCQLGTERSCCRQGLNPVMKYTSLRSSRFPSFPERNPHVCVCYDPFGIELDPVYDRLTVNDVAIKTHHRRRLVTPLGCSYLKELPRNCLSPDRRIVFLKPLKCRVKPSLRGMFYGCR